MGGSHNSTSGSTVSTVDSSHTNREFFMVPQVPTVGVPDKFTNIAFSNLATLAP